MPKLKKLAKRFYQEHYEHARNEFFVVDDDLIQIILS